MREREIETYLVKRAKACGGELCKVRWIAAPVDLSCSIQGCWSTAPIPPQRGSN